MTELPEHVRPFFEGANYAHLATLMPDGEPHSVPVCVSLEGGRIAFLTPPGSLKVRNLERDPRRTACPEVTSAGSATGALLA
jgi:nitroimidazol reductase NimA-like FMN-containing flavoprotein (pyridoxamine 5'-phosphate oxidase superfamily)